MSYNWVGANFLTPAQYLLAGACLQHAGYGWGLELAGWAGWSSPSTSQPAERAPDGQSI